MRRLTALVALIVAGLFVAVLTAPPEPPATETCSGCLIPPATTERDD